MKEPKYYRETKFGHRIVSRFIDGSGRRYVIVERHRGNVYSAPCDYIAGCGYDEDYGTWAQGYYDFPTAYRAEEYLRQNYRVKLI